MRLSEFATTAATIDVSTHEFARINCVFSGCISRLIIRRDCLFLLFQGGKHSHQDCEGIWFWEIKNAVFTNLRNGRTITAPELKVTAVEAKGSMPQAGAGR